MKITILLLLLPCCSPIAATEATRHTVKVDGHAFAVWEKRAENPVRTILLLHGRTWSSIPDFDLVTDKEDLSLMNALTEHGYAVYALDLRGYGGTPRDHTGWLSPNQAARDLASVLKWVTDHDGVDGKPALFGWSFGSTISQLCVQENPDLVSHLVLYGYWFDPDMTLPELPDPNKLERKPATVEAAASDFIVPGSISKEAVDAYVKACLAADPARVDVRRSHQFNALDPALIKVPTLVIHGEHDPYAKPQPHARLFTRLGSVDKRWVVIADGDHAAHLEKSRDRFIEALIGFLGPSKK